MTTPQKKKSYEKVKAGKQKDKEKRLKREKKRKKKQEREVFKDVDYSTKES